MQSEMLSIESGTDAASGLAIAILDDVKILIPLNRASKDYSLHSGKVPLTFMRNCDLLIAMCSRVK